MFFLLKLILLCLVRDRSRLNTIQLNLDVERYVGLFWIWCVLLIASAASNIRSLYPVLFFAVFSSLQLFAMIIDRIVTFKSIQKMQFGEEDNVETPFIINRSSDDIKYGRLDTLKIQLKNLFIFDRLYLVLSSYFFNLIPLMFAVNLLERTIRIIIPYTTLYTSSDKIILLDFYVAVPICVVLFLCVLNLLPTLHRSGVYVLLLLGALFVGFIVSFPIASTTEPFSALKPRRIHITQSSSYAYAGKINQQSIQRTDQKFSSSIIALDPLYFTPVHNKSTEPYFQSGLIDVSLLNYKNFSIGGVQYKSITVFIKHHETTSVKLETDWSVFNISLNPLDLNYKEGNYYLENRKVIEKYESSSDASIFDVVARKDNYIYLNVAFSFCGNPNLRSYLYDFMSKYPVTPTGIGHCDELEEQLVIRLS
ncbi:hypothetical protein AKO1_014905 [Acrasis kona]|uniref:Uncharacterized protein n=1 Tax=Acrasis kona TaxID=1008807 RepID=A0AAW2Z0Z5_9EUKA